METIQEIMGTTDVELLKSQLLKRRTSVPRFRLPYPSDIACDMLLAAVMAEVEFRHGTFIDSDIFRRQLECIARWLTSDTSKFGILLCGFCGNGKSTFVKALQQLLNILSIREPYSGECYGLPIIRANDLFEVSQEEMHRQVHVLSRKPLLAIDDLGTEPVEVMHYGNVSSPIIRLLSNRYEEQRFTVITSNLSPKDITRVYGERIGDRLSEMLEILPFENPSYRKGNLLQTDSSIPLLTQHEGDNSNNVTNCTI